MLLQLFDTFVKSILDNSCDILTLLLSLSWTTAVTYGVSRLQGYAKGYIGSI